MKLFNTTYALLAVALSLVASSLHAQVTNDPTRPPAALLPNTGGADGDADSGAPLLQSIMIGPAGRTAIIGGELVKQGGKYGDARVVKITDNEVVLRTPTGTETLTLYAGVGVKPAAVAQPATAKATAKKPRAAANNSPGTQK